MKRLTIEEKAEAYDKAIRVAKSKIKNDKDHVLYEHDITDIFPELKESEDMQIMKEIAEFIYISAFKPKDIKKKEKWLDWLEKQAITQESEWSEEDENRFSNLIFLVNASSENKATKKGFIDFINKIKSIRPKTSDTRISGSRVTSR